MECLAKETFNMFKFAVAGYTGSAAIDYAYNRYVRDDTLEKENHQQLEEDDTTDKSRNVIIIIT